MDRVSLIENLTFNVKYGRGHKFLYEDFVKLVYSIGTNHNLSNDEIIYLDELISTLLSEAEQYSSGYPYYPLWATRCMDCAAMLAIYLPTTSAYKEKLFQRIYRDIHSFLLSPILKEFIHTQSYKVYRDEIIKSPQMLCKVASNCFYLSDEGRRPRDLMEEKAVHVIFEEGYNLANLYLQKTADMSRFPDWFSHMSFTKIANIVKQLDLNISSKGHESILNCLKDTMNKQRVLLQTWYDNDYEGFVKYWGVDMATTIIESLNGSQFLQAEEKVYIVAENGYIKGLYSNSSDLPDECKHNYQNYAIPIHNGILILPQTINDTPIYGVMDFWCMGSMRWETASSKVRVMIVPGTYRFIGQKNFSYYETLETLYLPKNIELREFAFAYCPNLTKVYIGVEQGEEHLARKIDKEQARSLFHKILGIFDGCNESLQFYVQ